MSNLGFASSTVNNDAQVTALLQIRNALLELNETLKRIEAKLPAPEHA